MATSDTVRLLDTDALSTVAELQARLDGAPLAVILHALRRAEVERATEVEREERRAEAERDLRLMLARTTL